ASYNVSTLAEGTNTMTVIANDSLGHYNQTQYVSFTVDYTNPSVTLNSPPDQSIFSLTSSNQTFNATVNDNNFVQNVYFGFDNSSGANFNVSAVNQSGYWTASYNVSTLAEGVHIVTTFANDSSGNANNTQTVTFTFDSTPPNVTNLLPENTSISDRVFNVSNIIEIGANVTDVTYISAVFANISYPNGSVFLFQLNNGSGYPSKFNRSFTIPALIGNYNITFIANDTSNNRNATQRTNFTVNDVVKPKVSIILPASGSNFVTSTNITINVNVTDDVNVSIVNATITAPNGSIFIRQLLDPELDTIYTAAFNNTETSGIYNISISANDSSNNINNTQFRTFNIQSTTPPLTILVSPADGVTLTSASFNFTCNATDSSGLANITLYHNISGTFVINQTAVINGTGNQTNFTINSVPDGKEYGWNCLAFDSSGNNAFALNNFTFSVDTAPPAVTNVQPSLNSRFNISTTISVNATVTDTFGVSAVLANITLPNGSSTLLTLGDENSDNVFNNSFTIPNIIGLYNITIIANDTYAHKNSTETTNFTAVDSIFPAVTWIAPTNQSNYSIVSSNQTFNVSVVDLAIDTILFSFDNASGTGFNVTALNHSGYWSASYNVSVLAEGVHIITAIANDTSNNVNNSASVTITVDFTAPLVTVTAPANNSNYTISSSNQTFSANIGDLTIQSVLFSFDNASGANFNTTASNNSGTWSASYNVSTLAEGANTMTVIANDSVGHYNQTQYVSFIVDYAAPRVAITAPANNSNYSISSSNQTFSATISEENYVQSVLFSFDNASGANFNATATNNSGTWSTSYNVSTLAEGANTMAVIANDSAGNYNQTRYVSFIVDYTAPLVTITAPANNSNYSISSSNQTFNANISDLTIQSVLFSFDNASGANFNATATNNSGAWSASYNVSTLAEGTNTMTVIANDSLGHYNQTQYVSFAIDNTPPVVSWLSPTNYSNYSIRSSNQTFNASISDLTIQTVLFSFSNNTGTPFNISAVNQSGNWIASYNVSTLAEGPQVVTVIANDSQGYLSNNQHINITVDKTIPTFNSLTTSPSSEAELDPNVNITVFANVTDNVTGIHTLVVQYKLSTGTLFTNLTPNYNSQTLIYNISFNATTAGTYNLQLWANDSSGNSAQSNMVNISVQLDRNWTRTPSVFAAVRADLNNNVSLGNLTINNSGDFPFHFNISSDSNKTYYNSSSNFTLSSGEVRQIEVLDNATVSGVKTVTLNISVNDTAAVPYSLTTVGTIAVAPGQPILVATITTPSAETLTVTQGNVNVPIVAKIDNIGEGNATNVTFFLTLPSDWVVTFGDINKTYNDFFSGDSDELNLEVRIPSDASTGAKTIVANATGFNSTGTDLAGQNLLFGDTVAVTVNALAATLGAVGGAAAAVTSSTSPGDSESVASGAGGGGGGAGAITTSEVFDILRGKQQTFTIRIENIYENTVMNNVQLKLDGFLAKYVTWNPSILNGIRAGESQDFYLTITVPDYFTESEYQLTASITATLDSTNKLKTGYASKTITEKRKIILRIKEIAEEDLGQETNIAEQCLADMEKAGFNTIKLKLIFDLLII
ncbi:MAG: hypothetical protein HY361_05420, partial [Candidatus Aenigmarchaeota archaeon]|nr:hypothetical protein [Candidatus Aenigmarchaeota archaeon]